MPKRKLSKLSKKSSKSKPSTSKSGPAQVPKRKAEKPTAKSLRSKPTRRSTTNRTPVLEVPTEKGDIEFLARGVLFRGSTILLCQNVKHGYYYLPGGHIEFSESAERALRREFQEEMGLDIRVGPLLIADETSWRSGPGKRLHHEVNLVFHVELSGARGQTETSAGIQSKEDHLNFAWIELAAVPELDLRPLTAKAFVAAGAGENRCAATAEWVSAMFKLAE